MRFKVWNKLTQVKFEDLSEIAWLEDQLTVTVPNAKYTTSFQRGRWDGKKRFLNRSTLRFPSGFIPSLLEGNSQRRRPFNIKLQDERGDPDLDLGPHLSTREWYRHLKKCGFTPDEVKCEYQCDAINSIVGNYLDGIPWVRGIIDLPTGSGKTILASGIVHLLDQPRTIVLCDRLDLFNQTREVLSQVFGCRIGAIQGHNIKLENITVAMVQTLAKKMGKHHHLDKWLKGVKVFVADECHKVGDNQYHKVISTIPAYVRLGLSATPLSREDIGGVILVGDTGEVIYKISPGELTTKGLLAKPEIRMIPIDQPTLEEPPIRDPDPDRRRKKATDRFRRVYKAGIVLNDHRNNQIGWICELMIRNKYPTLILVKLLSHGRVLYNKLCHLFENVDFIHGEDKLERRSMMVEKFKAGHIPIMIASTIFDEAIDIPNIRCLVLAGGGNSPIKAIQRVGRGMRVKPGGDNRLLVYDFLDKVHPSLENNSRQRMAIYANHGYEVMEL